MRVQDIDYIELTVDDLEQATRFYHEVLDLSIIYEGNTKMIFQLGKQKLVCRTPENEDLTADHPTVGSTTFSILAKDSLHTIQQHLANYFIEIIKGPVKRTLKNKTAVSLYINDPAGNLIEIREYEK
ncbi:VOC family protein [Fructilactobacillus lindneri]|uniref:Lactoylglutathione lyase n=1 Tax=Fructilactobacillus lindneri TaxID=53444 RepID=A0AB33BGW9_9LACO|nr:VOC family protein [Fructilactobacillus lindneri]ANZ57851.1 lactoylglutathione lyase [Fructilactobacillus lindneri]ANZ59120.1 lactoylglutathione lyase [Fructilactobacillus lindneri]POG98172.1 lactoylglutathione lyase [Fructilactobacillus lindneri]POH01712.1 lactoylglutathione lyase [Fructilactobacillus lindneri]POH03556.1 lactoylglutathione lyase [Fructilactobacillus lindneri]